MNQFRFPFKKMQIRKKPRFINRNEMNQKKLKTHPSFDNFGCKMLVEI